MKIGYPRKIHTIDLNFLGTAGSIAAYLIQGSKTNILIESGPGTCANALVTSLGKHNLRLTDIEAVFLTHIHLDHAGAAGWLAKQGLKVFVHPVGAPHLINPEKLLISAARIYGDQMERLWGEVLPVPENQVFILEDNQEIEIGDLHLRALDTPGHANHHFAYIIGDTCFSGDIGGIRLKNTQHIRIPMPPPELNLESWRVSVTRLENEYKLGNFQQIAPTHFGIFQDPGWHITAVQKNIDAIDFWMQSVMLGEPTLEQINQQFQAWTHQRALEEGMPESMEQANELANPLFMSALGMQRYWRKYRATNP